MGRHRLDTTAISLAELAQVEPYVADVPEFGLPARARRGLLVMSYVVLVLCVAVACIMAIIAHREAVAAEAIIQHDSVVQLRSGIALDTDRAVLLACRADIAALNSRDHKVQTEVAAALPQVAAGYTSTTAIATAISALKVVQAQDC